MKRFALVALCVGLAPATVRAQDVSARAVVKREPPVGVRVLDAEEAAGRPGSFGEPTRAALDQPGVARSGYFGSELIVWGASGNETRSYVDGVEVPSLFHASGLRGTVHPSLLRSITLVQGAAPAQYGRGIGGVVEAVTELPGTLGVHGTLRADAIDTSVTLIAASEHVRAMAAARQGYLDRVLDRLWPEADDVLALPSHRDLAFAVEGDVAKRIILRASVLSTRERTRLARVLSDVTERQNRSGGFDMASVRLTRRYADGARVELTPFFVRESRDERSQFGGTPLRLSRAGHSYGLRALYVRSRAPLELRVGLDARADRVAIERAGTLTLPAREGDIALFGMVPVDAQAYDRHRVYTLSMAPHLTLLWRVGPMELSAGLRLESYHVSVSRRLPRIVGQPALGYDRLDLLPEPRLGASYRVNAVLRLETRLALQHQLPDAADRSAIFGAPDLAPMRALHGTFGPSLTLPFSLRLEGTAFAKRLRDLPIRNADTPPGLAQALTSDGEGRVLGGSLSLERAPGDGLFGQVSYTLSRSLRTDPGGRLRRFDFDQPHIGSLLTGFSRAAFQVSLRLRAVSGAPRTSVVGRYWDEKTGRAQPLLGRHNAARSPTFFQLDAHGEYAFDVLRVRCTVFLDAINLTNHANVEQVAYTGDYSARRDVRGVPLLAMLGLKVER